MNMYTPLAHDLHEHVSSMRDTITCTDLFVICTDVFVIYTDMLVMYTHMLNIGTICTHMLDICTHIPIVWLVQVVRGVEGGRRNLTP